MPDRPSAVITKAERAVRTAHAILRQAVTGHGYEAGFADWRAALERARAEAGVTGTNDLR